MARKPDVTFSPYGVEETFKTKMPENQLWTEVIGWSCPECGGTRVQGTGRRIESHSVYAADGGCMNCKKVQGVIRVRVYDTLFGLEEDEALSRYVTIGGGKVY